MALKVVFVLLVAMLLFTKNNGEIVGGVKECLEECFASCGEDKHCKSACAVACAFSATHNVEIQTRVGDWKECAEKCFASCGADKHCKSACAIACSYGTTHNVQIQTRECNIGCSLGHCYKFLINKYDHDKFGGCMTSCNDNYCVDGKIIFLSKA
uniref:Putative ovule protein n=1 Tax=Solanum chacoense TaxID=4108 RepID=A0A0V0IS39_SOLCH